MNLKPYLKGSSTEPLELTKRWFYKIIMHNATQLKKYS